MPVHRGTVLADANTMIEANRTGCWNALAGVDGIETVEKCFEETQTGAQRRRPEHNIDPTALRASLRGVHPVTLRQRAAASLLLNGTYLDAGELDLWAHALTRDDAWVLCGPDTASMRFGYQQGRRGRLVTLGGLLADIKFRPAIPLKGNYEKEWLERLMSQMTLGIL